MKVEPNGVSLNGLNSPELAKPAPSQADKPAAPEQDKATLSLNASGVGALAQKALSVPEVRQDKVDALRQAIQRGEYTLDPGKIAQALIDESQ
ncbi:MAG: flagellar biosynthesis anti-sigma factor FlgM [Acidobacteriia bacterium]|nr:flagellar biosynthesis anti-sigma factor FlgM [Terriglobia bacterium]